METIIGNILFYGAFIIGTGICVTLWRRGRKGWAGISFVVTILVASLGRGILMSV